MRSNTLATRAPVFAPFTRPHESHGTAPYDVEAIETFRAILGAILVGSALWLALIGFLLALLTAEGSA